MQGERKQILIVDDQAVNRKIMKKILEETYEIDDAENGEIAWEKMQNMDYAAIVLDLMMPVMNGYELLEKIRISRMSNIPVLVMTSSNEIETEKKVFDLGAWDYVVKPIQPQILLSRLGNAIARSQVTLFERLRYVLEHDTMTGMYNRAKLFENARKMINANPDITFAFIRFDIDRFRLFNSGMGEEEGDRLIIYIAHRLEEMCEEYEVSTYGRIDADVFCLCIPYNHNRLQKMANLMQLLMDGYMDEYTIETSFGVYVIEDSTQSIENMLTKAAMASEKCKDLCQSHIAFYDSEMGKKVEQEQSITNDMKLALEKEEFVVYLQQKYDLRTNKPFGAEALVRWMHPTKGLVSPGVFIPVFEQNGFIGELDYYMWEHVCNLLHRWKEEKRNVAPVSVNISRVSLYNPHIVELLTDLIEKYELTTADLNLEITESAYMSNPNLMNRTITRLQEAGFEIMIDDFGSGYSSLNTLKEMNVEYLKIDMKFLPQKNSDGKSEKIMSSIVRMAGWIGMSVIAEGVETLEQKKYLESIGCEFVQGYFYARPMPVEQYEELMQENLSTTIIKEQESKTEYDKTDAIWSSNPQVDEILKSISLPVVIYEHTGQNVEVVRANHEFIELFGTRKAGPWDHNNDLDDENQYRLRMAFRNTIEKKCNTETDFSCMVNGILRWFRIKLQLLGSIPGSNLLSAIYQDITVQKQYEEKLHYLQTVIDHPVSKQKILIVDDLQIGREILIKIFKDEYDILEADSGEEALDVLKSEKDVAIILLDMIMPEMTGEEFLVEKNKYNEYKNIPVIVVSAESNEEVQKRMLELGVNDYVTKPFIPQVVKQRLKNVLDYSSRFQNLMKEYHSVIDKE